MNTRTQILIAEQVRKTRVTHTSSKTRVEAFYVPSRAAVDNRGGGATPACLTATGAPVRGFLSYFRHCSTSSGRVVRLSCFAAAVLSSQVPTRSISTATAALPPPLLISNYRHGRRRCVRDDCGVSATYCAEPEQTSPVICQPYSRGWDPDRTMPWRCDHSVGRTPLLRTAKNDEEDGLVPQSPGAFRIAPLPIGTFTSVPNPIQPNPSQISSDGRHEHFTFSIHTQLIFTNLTQSTV